MSEPVKRAADTVASFVQDMGINHGRSYIFVPHQLLDGSDVVSGFKKMRRKRMSEGVTSDVLDYAGFANGLLYSPLENGLMDVVAAFLAGLDVLPTVLLGEDPLPALFRRTIALVPQPGAVFDLLPVRHAVFLKPIRLGIVSFPPLPERPYPLPKGVECSRSEEQLVYLDGDTVQEFVPLPLFVVHMHGPPIRAHESSRGLMTLGSGAASLAAWPSPAGNPR